MDGQPEAPDDEQGEQHHDEGAAHQSQLLQDHGEDVVVLGLGEVAELLAALAQTHPQQSAGADGVQPLNGLPGRVPPEFQVAAEGVLPHGDPGGVVVDGLEEVFDHVREGQQVGPQTHGAHASRDPAPVDAPHHQHGRADARDEDGPGEVGLQRRHHHHHQQDADVVEEALLEVPHLLPLFGDGLREKGDEAQLRQVRGLEGQGGVGDAQPPGRAVGADGQQASVGLGTGDDDQEQQDQGHPQAQPRQAPEALVVDFGHPQHQPNAQSREDRLPLDEVQGVVAQIGAGLRVGEAGGEEHDEPDAQQHHGQQQEGHIQRPPGGFPGLLPLAPVLPLLLALELAVLVPGEGNAVPGADGTRFLLGHGQFLLS